MVKSILHIITYYFGTYLKMLDVGDLSVSMVYAALVPFNFKLSEWVYDRIIFEAFNKHEKFLHEIFKKIR